MKNSYFHRIGFRVVHFGFGWGIMEVDNYEDPSLVEYPPTQEGAQAAQDEARLRNSVARDSKNAQE
jgi:hypothetical protein